MGAPAALHTEHASETPEQKVKKYFKVFWVLFGITVFEVAVVYLPIPKIIIDCLVVCSACAKAAAVGYYYMHLEHETKWLKVVAILPLIAFAYAVFLVSDGPKRPIASYPPEVPRVYQGHDEHEAAESLEKTEFFPGDVPSAPEPESVTAAPLSASPPSKTEGQLPAAGGQDPSLGTKPGAPAGADDWK